MKIKIYDKGKLVHEVEFTRGLLHLANINDDGLLSCEYIGSQGSYVEACRMFTLLGRYIHETFEEELNGKDK